MTLEVLNLQVLTKIKMHIDKGNSLSVQWLNFRVSTAGGIGSIPDGGTKILHTLWCSLNK